jgi:hypothetical protein
MRFCTKLDHFYLDRGLALYSSLRETNPEAELHVLALSQEAEDFLESKSLPGLSVIRLHTVIASEPALASARSTRTKAEFAFTLTPFLVCETLKDCPTNEWVIYVDADMLFFGSVAEVLRHHQAADVLMSRHHFSDHMKEQQRYGTFNTGFTAFRKTADGEKCAKWWATQCLAWCHDRLENGKFADQKYIEQFPNIVPKAVGLDHPGVNCAPWNASGRRFGHRSGITLVDNCPLILYHFAKVKRINASCIATRKAVQGVKNARGLNRRVYKPYAKALEDATSRHGIPQEWVLGGNRARDGVKQKHLARDGESHALRFVAGLIRGDFVSSRI